MSKLQAAIALADAGVTISRAADGDDAAYAELFGPFAPLVEEKQREDAQDNIERELEFQTEFGFAAPTGYARDVEIPNRNSFVSAMLAMGDGQGARRLAWLCGGQGVPGCMGVGTFYVHWPQGAPPNPGGWPQFSLGPSRWEQLTRDLGASLGLTETEVFNGLRTGWIEVPAAFTVRIQPDHPDVPSRFQGAGTVTAPAPVEVPPTPAQPVFTRERGTTMNLAAANAINRRSAASRSYNVSHEQLRALLIAAFQLSAERCQQQGGFWV